jgi:hypothetical protein
MESPFDIRKWQANVFSHCLDDPFDLRRGDGNVADDLPETIAFQVHSAKECLRLLRRLWNHPGDRIDGFLPEQELWQWLRRQTLGQACGWQLWILDHASGFRDGEYRWNATRRLYGLIPAMAQARRDPGPREREEADLNKAADVLSGLIVDTRSFTPLNIPWPQLETIGGLIDELVYYRSTPVPLKRPGRRASPGAPRKGPDLNVLYQRLVDLFEEYHDEGLRPPTKRDMAEAIGLSLTTLDERIKELKELNFTWPIDIRNSA